MSPASPCLRIGVWGRWAGRELGPGCCVSNRRVTVPAGLTPEQIEDLKTDSGKVPPRLHAHADM